MATYSFSAPWKRQIITRVENHHFLIVAGPSQIHMDFSYMSVEQAFIRFKYRIMNAIVYAEI